MKIKYEEKRGYGITPCPHNKTIKVGSTRCSKCKFFCNIDSEKREVECGKEGMNKDEETGG